MPKLKIRAQCATCKAVKADPELLRRISLCKRFVPGGEPLAAIERDYQLPHKGLYNHVAKHQAPNQAKLDKQIKQFETRQALKDIESGDEKRVVAVYAGQAEARKDILTKAMQALEDGDVKLTMSSIVALLGQEQKAEENAKDRGLKMMEMFNYFASGAGKSQPEHTEAEIIQ